MIFVSPFILSSSPLPIFIQTLDDEKALTHLMLIPDALCRSSIEQSGATVDPID
jgi:hypothetical protein